MKLDSTGLVAKQLAQDPKSRDNDLLLVLKVWIEQMGGLSDAELIVFRKVLRAHNNKLISNFETIRRTRQKLQEENPDLRGKKYNNRQDQAEKFRKEIVK